MSTMGPMSPVRRPSVRSLTCWENVKLDLQIEYERKKVGKGVWRMPWLLQAMKDVTSCEKPREGANDL